MTSPDDQAYEAQVSEILDSVKNLRRRCDEAEVAYKAALGWASSAEQRATQTVESAEEHIERSLRNARQAVAGLVEDTLIPPRMRASSVEPNVGRADVEEAMAQLDRSVINLRALADQVRAARVVPPPTRPDPTPPKPIPVRTARSPWLLVVGIALAIVILIVLFTIVPR